MSTFKEGTPLKNVDSPYEIQRKKPHPQQNLVTVGRLHSNRIPGLWCVFSCTVALAVMQGQL